MFRRVDVVIGAIPDSGELVFGDSWHAFRKLVLAIGAQVNRQKIARDSDHNAMLSEVSRNDRLSAAGRSP
jgi:hypothetical protein